MFNNDDEFVPKQINNVVKPTIVGEEMKEKPIEIPIKKEEINEPQEHYFVIILLIILAIVVAIICYLVIPALARKEPLKYNDATTTTAPNINNYISEVHFGTTSVIDFPSDIKINNHYQMSLKSNETFLDIYVNNKLITKAEELVTKGGIVDNLLMFMTQNKNSRSAKLYVVNILGEIVYELQDVNDGLALLPNSSSIVFNNTSFVILTSRVYGTNLFANNAVLDICNEEELKNNNIGYNFPALANYHMEYIDTNTFSKPNPIHYTSLEDYIKANNLCQ